MTPSVEAAIARLTKITTHYDEIAHEAPVMIADEFAVDVKVLRTLITAYREAERDAEIAAEARAWYSTTVEEEPFSQRAYDHALGALLAAIAKGASHAG